MPRLITLLLILAAAALCYLPALCFGQTSGQYEFRLKNTGAGFTAYGVTPQNSKAFGIDGSGNLSMLSVGGSSTLGGLSDVSLTSLVSAQLLRYNGTAWVNWTPDFITSSALSPYLTTSTAASTYLTISNAASTYLTTSTAASTYLTISNAASTYLTPTGNGSGLTALNASSLSSGTVSDSRLSANVSLLGSSIALGSEVTGTLPIANGGTGQTTASAARLALLPSLTGNANKVLTVNSGATDVQWSTPSSGGSSISTPKVVYVESNGNDGTGEIGNPAKPYATGTAAYNAGQATSTAFAISFGTGSFDLYINEPPYLSALQGQGEGLTTVNLYANGQNSTDENAGAGFDLDLKLLHLTVNIQANGGEAGGMSGAGGTGGNVTLRGLAYVSVSATGGNGPSGGAVGGNIILNSSLRVSSVNIGGASGSGTLTADGCDLREVFYSGVYSTIGRCSYTAANFTIGNDKGGNAAY
jgi:hypothetical protein